MPKVHRPITSSNFLLKTIERVIHWFLCEITIALPLLNQHENTRWLGMGSFADLVESEFHRGKKSLIVSLDCVVAFDQKNLSYVEETLHQLGFPIMITSGTIWCSLDAL